MPPSPTKRVTRSRSAASNTAGDVCTTAKAKVETKTSTSKRAKQTSASAHETANPAKCEMLPSLEDIAPAATTARRKIKVTPLEPRPTDNAEIKPRSSRKAQSQQKDAVAPKKSAKPKCDSNSAIEGNVESKTTKKPNTRRKRDENSADKQGDHPNKKPGRPTSITGDKAMEESELAPRPIRQTRTRAASQTMEAASIVATNKPTTTAARKKVTFQDVPDSDKENRISQTKKSSKRGTTNAAATGQRARPVRKVTAINANKKSAANTKQKPMPLSPKKITQVTTSTSPENSDDELNGSKTPVRDLSLSPKRNMVKTGTSSPMRKLDFGIPSLAQSPNKELSSSAIMSPPRRPPASPFKDALKASPKRGDMAFVFPPSPAKSSSISLVATSAPLSQSMLLQSPKRGPLDPSVFAHSAMKPPRSSTKTTLLQSPARRFLSPIKADMAIVAAEIRGASPEDNRNDNFDLSPETTITPHFRASRSPMRSHKVHRIREEDLAAEERDAVDFDESVLDIRSPIKLPTSLIAPEQVSEIATPTADCNTIHQAIVENRFENVDGHGDHGHHQSMVWSPDPIRAASTSTSATSIQPSYGKETFHPNPSIFENGDSSEDELQVDTTTIFNFASATPGSSSRGSRTPLSTVNPADTSKNVAFTPLAKKLSSWCASSPDKTVKNLVDQRSVFSPAAAQHVPGEVQVSRQSTPLRHSPLFRRNSPTTTPRSTSTPTMAGASFSPCRSQSPAKSSFFADEMIVKDLELELEEKHPIPNEQTNLGENDQAMNTDPVIEDVCADTESMQSESIIQFITDSAFFESVNQEKSQTETESRHDSSEGGLTFAAVEPENHNQVSAPDGLGTSTSTELEQDECQSVNDISSTWNATTPGQTRLDGESEPAQVAHESVATPPRPNLDGPRYVNTTISKIPLRPEGDISPIKIPKKRSRSLSAGPSSAKRTVLTQNCLPKSNTVTSLSQEPADCAPDTPGKHSFTVDDFGDSTLDGIEVDEQDENFPPQTPTATIRPSIATAARTPLDPIEKGILQGAVVFVDVHTTEGADASSIFVELLSQMGARCVKNWGWNPRTSVVDVNNQTESAQSSRIGITHVVFKDGGQRTLEKVRHAGGVVWCVGVGWVLDCERERKWLPESRYAIDATILPRGGSRRRKSMEPRQFTNVNGSLSASRRSFSAEMTPAMKAELVSTPVHTEHVPSITTVLDDATDSSTIHSGFSTPTGVQAAFTASTTAAPMATPTGHVTYDPATSMSPTTPYYMAEGAKLVQHTCPPKQTLKGLFPVSGKIEDQPDEGMRRRLETVRRKTMNWRPRVASPLGK